VTNRTNVIGKNLKISSSMRGANTTAMKKKAGDRSALVAGPGGVRPVKSITIATRRAQRR